MQAACCMAHCHCVWMLSSGMWSYPCTEDVLKKVGLFFMTCYLNMKRKTIAKHVVSRHVYQACVEGRQQ